MKSMRVLELQGVYFSYGSEIILEDITVSVEEGDFLALLGPNGSGKTTLIKLVLGLLHPVRGEILLFGTDIGKFRAWYRIGYVPQKPTLDARFPATVREVVAAGRFGRVGLCHRLHREDWRAVGEALDLVGLLPIQDHLLTELSGGQQQRAFIARALAGCPEVLILDEPQTGLDDCTLRDFYQLLHYLNREKRITILMVSHDMDVVTTWASRIACLDRRLIYQGTPREIPAVGNMNHLYGTNFHSITRWH